MATIMLDFRIEAFHFVFSEAFRYGLLLKVGAYSGTKSDFPTGVQEENRVRIAKPRAPGDASPRWTKSVGNSLVNRYCS